jgi:hypothetical protein
MVNDRCLAARKQILDNATLIGSYICVAIIGRMCGMAPAGRLQTCFTNPELLIPLAMMFVARYWAGFS